MPATVTSLTPRRAADPGHPPPTGEPPRRPFRDNPRLILAGIGVLVVVLIALLAIASGTTSRFSPDFLSEFVLYALSAADLTMLAALVFVLARNIIKLVVERRRALPFARFRAKLVALLLVMTLVPTVLVLIVGSELIRTNIDRWFNAPMAEILSSANQIAGDYYHEQQMLASDHANRSRTATSSASWNATQSPVARARPRFRAADRPPCAPWTTVMRPAYRASTSGVSSVDPSSTTITSTGVSVWAKMLSRLSCSQRPQL